MSLWHRIDAGARALLGKRKGKFFSLPIGQRNIIQGHTWGLDLSSGERVCLTVRHLHLPEVRYHAYRGYELDDCLVGWSMINEDPSASEAGPILNSLRYALDQAPVRRERRTERAAETLSSELPAELYPVLAAAIRDRFEAWPGLLCLNPEVLQLRDAEDEPLRCYRLDLVRLRLDRPCVASSCPDDWIEFYSSYPEATGAVRLAVDPESSQVHMDHDTGGRDSSLDEGWDGPEDARPDGPLPRSFNECLEMERTSSGWRLAARREFFRDEPPARREMKAHTRLVSELGYEVLSVKVDRCGDLIACRLRAEDRVYEFVVGSCLESRLYFDPLVIVGTAPITAKSIRDGIAQSVQARGSD